MRQTIKVALLLATLILLLGAGFWVNQHRPYTAGSEIGYYLGLVGGVSMLLLLTYPMRKHLRFMRSWSTVAPWFRVHMILGIVGPLCVIFHSGFHIGSINAWVAMLCMLLVSGSGIIGRFVYVRIHHGLYGRQATLREMEERLEARDHAIRTVMDLVPDIEPLLTQYRNTAFEKKSSFLQAMYAFFAIGTRGFIVQRKCKARIAVAFALRSQERGWSGEKLDARSALANGSVADYVRSVRAAAQFQGYEQIFRWWHILHIPLVYLLVFSGFYHVLAVHMY
jgi:hypothetical protein